MLQWDPGYVSSITYIGLNEVVLIDRRLTTEPSRGWQKVCLYPSLETAWVHPATLGRFVASVEVLDGSKQSHLQPFQHYVNVRSMAGMIPNKAHTGLCEQLLRVKMLEGDLLGHVIGGLAAFRNQHRILSFGCDWGKHRSVAARTVYLSLCPLAVQATSGKNGTQM